MTVAMLVINSVQASSLASEESELQLTSPMGLWCLTVPVLVMFFQRSKPWRYNGVEEKMEKEDIKMPVNKLRDIYNDETLDYNKNLQQLFAALLEADTVHFTTTHPLLG
ncbi:hypothetical protein L1049_021064 [Liquidambar formosana]|uniref:Uncharacterized protein n=1 Tax=Liquidambar formosana TaxID=63359 RepID=A0AAP0XB44_LIQFO